MIHLLDWSPQDATSRIPAASAGSRAPERCSAAWNSTPNPGVGRWNKETAMPRWCAESWLPRCMNATWRSETTPPAGAAPGAPARLDQVQSTARAQYRPSLAACLPPGCPNQVQSTLILRRLAEAADVIELGWPFSFSERQDGRIVGDLR
jgi:hypothetical protein